MDPVSQAVVGAALPQSVSKAEHQKWALIAGAAGGMAPDLDIFIRSGVDPLLFLEFHRQFTHSFLFIPVGGLLVALALYPFLRKSLSFWRLYLFTALGYATHGLLDACTSYGTQLYWPFSNERVAWNNIGIVDPLPTLTLLIAVIGAAYWKSVNFARMGFLFFLGYLLLGVYQREKAADMQDRLIQSRNHEAVRKTVKPTIGNLLVWRSIYEGADGRYYVDALRTPFFGEERIYEGDSIEKVVPQRDFQSLPPNSRQRADIERFSWFSDGYIGRIPGKVNAIGDIRYALLPHEIKPMWGIEIDPNRPDSHVRFETFREITAEARNKYFSMILGREIPSNRKADATIDERR